MWRVGERRSGYCAVTQSADPGSCQNGRLGSWVAEDNNITKLEDCAARCVEHCERCRYVTFGNGDCSWYFECPQLHDGNGFVSLHVRTRQKMLAASAPPLQQGQLGYATLLSHASFLPGTVALLASLRAGGAQLPATVLATRGSILPGTRPLLARLNATVRLVEGDLSPPERTFKHMRARQHCHFRGGPSNLTARGLDGTHDCSNLQRLSTYAKLHVFDPSATGYDVVLFIDSDSVVATDSNLDVLFSRFPYALPEQLALSAAGSLKYFNSGVMLLRPSLQMYEEMKRILSRDAQRSFTDADDPGDQEVITHWAQAHKALFRPLPGCVNIRQNWPGAYLSWTSFDGPKVMHFNGSPKPWITWFGERTPRDMERGVTKEWPAISWGVQDDAVQSRMGVHSGGVFLEIWKAAWNAFVK